MSSYNQEENNVSLSNTINFLIICQWLDGVNDNTICVICCNMWCDNYSLSN